jgi:protein farnesyltransferase/geranylgeranyltransferase type-1 subunit alpha
MSDSMSDGEGDWVPYAERPGFAGLAPLPAADAGGRVVAIQYTPRHAECLAYLRAVVASGEGGDRALEVTADAIDHNSADYTAWQARWEALTSAGGVGADGVAARLREERGFTTAVSLVNVKNYQLWNHRRKLAQARARALFFGGWEEAPSLFFIGGMASRCAAAVAVA